MSGTEVMTSQERAGDSPSCPGPRPCTETAAVLAGQDHLAEEQVADFIVRHVLEQDAQLFDG